ncbi:hypothetical protein ACIA49_37970 [Kribbella sp. NPDC051587]|uniref:hypothetical protein n=1 Tax=Kribbella sp. NPDC051587 TaxID=3364119 RepID=UPI0037B800E0
MTPYDADAALARLRDACLGADVGARGELLEWLGQLRPADLVRLDERARWWSWSVNYPLGVRADWDRVVGRGDLLPDCVASMHADGYLREHATRLLASREGDVVARCLALRAVDHIEPVRRIALTGLTGRPDVVALGVLVRMRDRVHGPTALTSYRGEFELTELLAEPDLAVRRFAYDEVMSQLDSDQIARRLEVETDQWLRRQLAERWMAIDPVEAKGRLLSSRYVEGRLTVLLDGTDELFERSELETLMLDRSRRIQTAARWRYRRAGHDPAQFYRSHWKTNDAALLGLRETGQRLTEAEARTALTSPDSPRRLAALHVWPTDLPPKDLLLTLLADPSGAVVKHVARLLAATPGIRYDDLADAATSPHATHRRAAWRVRHQLGAWNRVRADLEALRDPDTKLVRSATDDLTIWLTFHSASTFQPLLPTEREAIRTHLTHVALSPDVARQIRFHAGIR